jgi:hypothetical protein
MCNISYKCGKNETYQIFTYIYKPNLAYFTNVV